MNLRTITALAILLTTTAAVAQPAPPPPDPAFMQAAIISLQGQRNTALDAQAAAEASAALLKSEIAKLQARVAELEQAKPKNAP